MMKRFIKSLGLVAIAAIVLQGCYPKEDLYYADLDVAVTHYDMDYDFSAINGKVCCIIDTIAHLVDEDDTPDGKYDETIIKQVLENLKASKFDTVYLIRDTSDFVPGREPHFVVTLTAWETDYFNYYYYPWGGWYWGWYWYLKSGTLKANNQANYYYYPWYPWGGSWYYAYSKGTILIDMVNAENIEQPENPDDEVKLPIIWTGALNGLVSGSTSDETKRIKDQIDQCFIQSPYLFE